VPDDVRDALTHHPAEQGVGSGRDRRAVLPDLRGDARVGQRRAGGPKLAGQAPAAVAGDRLPHLAERSPADLLDVQGLLLSLRGITAHQFPGDLGLHHHHRQGVPEQVVHVPGEPEPLGVHRRAGQFLPGPAQLGDGLHEAVDDGDDKTG
jgi:hypothetical protein